MLRLGEQVALQKVVVQLDALALRPFS